MLKDVNAKKKAATQYFNRLLKSNKNENIKLIAVAKNESPYLLEWIFHHLYFGFKEIDIYYNGCTDNTTDLIPLLADFPVNFINCDDTFNGEVQAPQVYVYRQAFHLTPNKVFDALLFLDIDEFWVPSDFTQTISDVCNNVGAFDTLSFQWRNKLEKQSKFKPAIEGEFSYEPLRQVKTLYRTYVSPAQLNPHNTLDEGLRQLFEDGSPLAPLNDQKSQVEVADNVKNAYILHRKERSEYEYIAMLLRGRPVTQHAEGLPLKANREGFKPNYKCETITYSGEDFDAYRAYMNQHMNEKRFTTFQKEAQEHVNNRYQLVRDLIENAEVRDKQLIDRLLRGVELPDILLAYNKFQEEMNIAK